MPVRRALAVAALIAGHLAACDATLLVLETRPESTEDPDSADGASADASSSPDGFAEDGAASEDGWPGPRRRS